MKPYIGYCCRDSPTRTNCEVPSYDCWGWTDRREEAAAVAFGEVEPSGAMMLPSPTTNDDVDLEEFLFGSRLVVSSSNNNYVLGGPETAAAPPVPFSRGGEGGEFWSLVVDGAAGGGSVVSLGGGDEGGGGAASRALGFYGGGVAEEENEESTVLCGNSTSGDQYSSESHVQRRRLEKKGDDGWTHQMEAISDYEAATRQFGDHPTTTISSSDDGAGSSKKPYPLAQKSSQDSANTGDQQRRRRSDVGPMTPAKELMYRAAVLRPAFLWEDQEPISSSSSPAAAAAAARPRRKNVRISSDPQTVAARHRRERISERLRALQRLVPGGNKMDTATMLDEAACYLKFLKSQVTALDDNLRVEGLHCSAPGTSCGSASTSFPNFNYKPSFYF